MIMTGARIGVLAVLGLYVLAAPVAPTARRTDPIPSLLESHLLVTYYGNPHSALMGVLVTVIETFFLGGG